MNKLGFAIKLASQGAGNAIECNKGQWTSKVVDIREYLKLFNGLQGTDNIVTFMTFDEGGCFLTQFRAISGRMGDFLSGWIYIPNTIEATGEDVMNAYNYVRNILSQSNLSDLKKDIESFFSKEYPSKEATVQYVASNGESYGYRFLKHYTLKEIVGEYRYQPYYSNYKAVFLLNKEEEVTIAKEAETNFMDLTNQDVVKISILVPPPTLGRGTKIHTIDGSEFNQPLLVNVGSKIPLILSRIGFENMKLEVNVISEIQYVNLSNYKITWKKKISTSMFTVRNSEQEKIDKEVRILVNGIDISSQELLLPEEDCSQALVKVSAPDFEGYEQKCDLLNDSHDITLSRKSKKVKTEVELSNGSHGTMIIEAKKLPSNYDSPLKGYEFKENNHGHKFLKLSSWFVWKQRVLGFLASLAAVMLIITYVAFDAWLDSHHFKWGLPPWEENTPAQQYTPEDYTKVDDDTHNQAENQSESEQHDAAITYLDNNSTWSKDSLDKYDATRGLFEELNEFKKEEIIKRAESLGNVQRLTDIVYAFENTVAQDHHIGKESNNGNYNSSTDKKIVVVNYIKWISKQHSPVVNNPSQVSKPQKSKITGKNTNTAPAQSVASGSSVPKRGGV